MWRLNAAREATVLPTSSCLRRGKERDDRQDDHEGISYSTGIILGMESTVELSANWLSNDSKAIQFVRQLKFGPLQFMTDL